MYNPTYMSSLKECPACGTKYEEGERHDCTKFGEWVRLGCGHAVIAGTEHKCDRMKV